MGAAVSQPPSSAASTWHIVTSEYPPQLGGVSDYARLVAAGLARDGQVVHVWAPRFEHTRPADPGVVLHDEAGAFAPADLKRLDAALDRYSGPRRVFIQWVPHGYGYRSMNVPFCLWVLGRARSHGDIVDIMVHEAFLPFRKDRIKENVAAAVHRLMTVILLRAATRIWYSIPTWEKLWRPYAMGRKIPFSWLPLPSTIPNDFNAAEVRKLRLRLTGGRGMLVGHFGTFGRDLQDLLLRILVALPAASGNYSVVLIGPGGAEAAAELIGRRPDLVDRVTPTGPLSPESVPSYLHACDVMLQPYTDGVSTRRTSFMAGLSLGRPTVTTLGVASEEFWKDSGAAVFAAPDDPVALAAAVAQLLTDSAARTRVAASARELYHARFDISHILATLRAS